MLLSGHCLGVRSSRQLERRCQEDLAFRVLAANQTPDHVTIARFRARHEQALAGFLLQSLKLCAAAGMVRLGTVALDGTKLAGNASEKANRTHDKIKEEVAEILRQMNKRELRAERDRVAALLRHAPADRTRLLAHTTEQRQRAEQGLTDATAREEAARDRVAELGQGAGRLLRSQELAEARDQHTLTHTAGQLARQQADRAADRQRQARRAQQEHLAWHERHPDLLSAARARARELAWRGRVDQRAIELERPGCCASSASYPPPSRASAPGGRLSAGSSSTGSATGSSTPTGRSAHSLATWTWSSAATTAPPTRQSSASTTGSAPCGTTARPARARPGRPATHPTQPSRSALLSQS